MGMQPDSQPIANPATPGAQPVGNPATGGSFLTVTEAARLAGVSRQALAKRIKRGTLGAVRVEAEGEVATRIPFEALAAAYPERDLGQPPAQPGLATGEQLRNPVAATPEPQAQPASDAPGRALAILAERHGAQEIELREQRDQALERASKATVRSRNLAASLGLTLTVAGLAAGAAWQAVGRAGAAEVRAADVDRERSELSGQLIETVGELGAASARADLAEADAERALGQVDEVAAERDDLAQRLRAVLAGGATARVMRRLFGV